MRKEEKAELRQLAKEGYSFQEIRRLVHCADSTIKQYIKVFKPEQGGINENRNKNK
jgi:predicted transcriptional regulator